MTELPPGASPVDAIAPGTRLREWEVLGLRGRGSYGVVFEARRSSWLDEPGRALKVFDPIVSTAARHALVREFSTLTAVRHPHLLAGIDAFDVEEPPFTGCVVFVLELADEDLAQRVARAGPLPAPEVAAIGADVAAGLGALHELGHVHGDVKPENILRVGPRWALGDFGVTGLLEGSYAITPGATIDYRPPEAADAPDGAPRHRAGDVWALGVTLHVAATAQHPFRGPDPMMRYASVLRGDRTVPPVALDYRLARIVDTGCLAPDPRQRLDATALATQLQTLAAAPPQIEAGPGQAPAVPPPLAPAEHRTARPPSPPPRLDVDHAPVVASEPPPPGPMPAAPRAADLTAPIDSGRPVSPPTPGGSGSRADDVVRPPVTLPHRSQADSHGSGAAAGAGRVSSSPVPRRPWAESASGQRWVAGIVSAVVGVAIAQVVALAAGELPLDLNVRRAVYLVVSSALLVAVAVVASRRWPASWGEVRTLALWAGLAGWAAATAVLFGFVG